jgi:LmbE family N-acetylglucosaminyl deacetylase
VAPSAGPGGVTSIVVRQIEQRLSRARPVRRGTAWAGHVFHGAMAQGAADATERLRARDALVLAPHPDDETLGCGGTIAAKVAAGRRVHVVVVTDGRQSHRHSRVVSGDELVAIRESELREACRRLGVADGDVRTWHYPDGGLEAAAGRLRHDLIDLLGELSPPEVLVPAAIDAHPDHRALHRAARAALAHRSNRAAVYAYPVWMWDPRAWVERDAPVAAQARQLVEGPWRTWRRGRRARVDVGEHLPTKRRAIEAYRSQLINLTGEPDWPTFDATFLAHFTSRHELFFEEAG